MGNLRENIGIGVSKKVYELTLYDTKQNAFISKSFYSNSKAGKESFEALKNHILEKYELSHKDVKKWTLSHNGCNRTELIADLYNISLIMWDMQKITSTWIK